jgi:hypothetical protein
MKIEPNSRQLMGATVSGFDLGAASDVDIAQLQEAVYWHRILLIKNQHLEPKDLIALGQEFGTIEVYYEPMYHHPEYPEIFVSGTKPGDSTKGVPQTVKIRPADVYRPIHEVQAEIERTTPAVFHPTVFRHPVTGEEILYVSEAGTFGFLDSDGRRLPPEVLQEVLQRSGQLDLTFTDPRIHLQTFVERVSVAGRRPRLHGARGGQPRSGDVRPPGGVRDRPGLEHVAAAPVVRLRHPPLHRHEPVPPAARPAAAARGDAHPGARPGRPQLARTPHALRP